MSKSCVGHIFAITQPQINQRFQLREVCECGVIHVRTLQGDSFYLW